MTKNIQNKEQYNQLVTLQQRTRQQVFRIQNTTMVCTNFEKGSIIVKEEQNGNQGSVSTIN